MANAADAAATATENHRKGPMAKLTGRMRSQWARRRGIARGMKTRSRLISSETMD